MKFFFGLLALIAAVVVVVLLFMNLLRPVDQNTGSNVSHSVDLVDQENIDGITTYTVRGPIVANEEYTQLRMSVSKVGRTIEVLKGYDSRVEKTETLPNSPEAYRAFLDALSAAQFAARRDHETGDKRTTCVTGDHYSYSMSIGAEKKVDSWTTSCSLAQGNFAGNFGATADLFRKQFPNYTAFGGQVNQSGFTL